MILGNKHGTCKLCLAVTDLCESHVVPEFCHSYEQSGHRRHAWEFLLPAQSDRLRKQKTQKGYREYLLCEDCEQRLSRHYENIFAPFWRNNVLQRAPFDVGQHVIVPKAPYHAVKLFLLSVFWRASVSELFGPAIQLGPYSEKLRDILLNDRRVTQDQYPILATLILNDDGVPISCVTGPAAKHLEQSHAYSMCLGECKWTIIMSDHWIPKRLECLKQVLCENGDLHLATAHFSQISDTCDLSQRLRREDWTVPS